MSQNRVPPQSHRRLFLGQDRLQQFPQPGDIPLSVPQVVDELSHGLFVLHLEELIEGAADRDHPEVLNQTDQGLTIASMTLSANPRVLNVASALFRAICCLHGLGEFSKVWSFHVVHLHHPRPTTIIRYFGKMEKNPG